MSHFGGRIYNTPNSDTSDPMLSNGRALILSEMADLLVRRIREPFVRNVVDFVRENSDKFIIITARPQGIGFPELDLARDVIIYDSSSDAEPLLESHLRCQEKFPPAVLTEFEFMGSGKEMIATLCSMDERDPRFGPWVSTLWQKSCRGEATPLDRTPEFERLQTKGDYYFVARRFRAFRQEAAKGLMTYLSIALALQGERD
jgi:hypothetical protein